jgi:hypothetical protein
VLFPACFGPTSTTFNADGILELGLGLASTLAHAGSLQNVPKTAFWAELWNAGRISVLPLASFVMAYPNSIAGMATTYQTITEGAGATVKANNTVVVHATGIVGETGKKFWSTKDAGAVRSTPRANPLTWSYIPLPPRPTAI